MTPITFPNEVTFQLFHTADLRFCEALALTNHQNYSILQTFVNQNFEKAILSDKVIHSIGDIKKTSLFFKLKVIRSVNLATKSHPLGLDFRCMIMSRHLNWRAMTIKAKSLGMGMYHTTDIFGSLQEVWDKFAEKDVVVLLSENAINPCNEFSVELPSAFELFSYHIFKEEERRNKIIGMRERYENEIEPFEECNSAEVNRIAERYSAEFNTIQEKYLNQSDGIEVPTSTNISGKDLRMKFLFNFDEENSTFRFFHQETNAQVQYIRGKIQL